MPTTSSTLLQDENLFVNNCMNKNVKHIEVMKKLKFGFIIGMLLAASSCGNKQEVYKEYLISDIKSSIADTLRSESAEPLSMFEVIIEGNINGEAALEFENGSGRVSRINLTGNINQTYATEWYSQKMYFKYIPISVVEGDSLKLRYRVY